MADYKELFKEALSQVSDMVKDATNGKSVNDVYQQGAEKISQISKLAKLKFSLGQDYDDQKRVFAEIGKLYFEQCKEPGEFFVPLFEQINDLNASIADKKVKIAEVKSSVITSDDDAAVEFGEVVDDSENRI